MARRRKSDSAIGGFIVLIVILGFIIQAVEGIGAFLATIDPRVYATAAALVVVVVVAIIAIRRSVRERRRIESARIADAIFKGRYQKLFSKYGDNETVAMIMNHLVWKGMTKDQLRDSLGPPEATSRDVLKTKIREEYKYSQVGQNRFLRRVRLENDVVVEWSKK